MNPSYRVPYPNWPFARTNIQTIHQRIAIIRDLFPGIRSIAELSCGDCARQDAAYRRELGIARYVGLDMQADIVKFNRSRGIECICGDALDRDVL